MIIFTKTEQKKQTIATGDFCTDFICDYGGVIDKKAINIAFEYYGELAFTDNKMLSKYERRVLINIQLSENKITTTANIETPGKDLMCLVEFTEKEMTELINYIKNTK